MKKLLVNLVALLALSLTQSVLAASAADILTNMTSARESLVKMLDEADAAKRDALEQEVQKATKAADEALTAVLADAATSADAKKALEEFQKIWTPFKETRDKEIIDALKAGKVEDAKKVATGIQKERFGNMKKILEEIK